MRDIMRWQNNEPGLTAPALGCFAVTPSDLTDLPERIRQVTISEAGAISYVNWEGVTCTSGTLPAGSYPLFATRILATGTTASGITGWF
jgi:hypothetical protein